MTETFFSARLIIMKGALSMLRNFDKSFHFSLCNLQGVAVKCFEVFFDCHVHRANADTNRFRCLMKKLEIITFGARRQIKEIKFCRIIFYDYGCLSESNECVTKTVINSIFTSKGRNLLKSH